MQPGSDTESNGVEKSSTGLDGNLAGLLCYFGFFATGIVFLVVEKQSAFVRFHAMQSTFAFIGLFVLHFVALLIPVLGPILKVVVQLATVALWIFLMIKAFQGERYRLPVVGDMVEQQLDRA